MKYTEHLVNSFFNSPHCGTITGADVVYRTINKETGDAVKIFMVIDDDKILNAKFQACGSVVLFASLSAIMDLIIDKTLQQALEITEKQVIKEIKQVNRCDYAMVAFAVKALDLTLNAYFKKQAKKKDLSERKERQVKVKSIKPATDITRCDEVTSNQTSIEELFKDKDNNKQERNELKVTEIIVKAEVEKVEETPNSVEIDTEPLIEELEDEPTIKPEIIESVPTKIEVRILEDEPAESPEIEELEDEVEQIKTIEIVSEPQEKPTKVKAIKVREPKRNYLIPDTNSAEKGEDVIDEIDSITAKLTDAISKLNFKFDVDDE